MKAVFLALILCFAQNLGAESNTKSAESSPKSPTQIAESTHFDEDAYILEVLEARDLGDDKKAIEIYEKLYKNTKKIEYLKERLFALVRLERHSDALDSANEILRLLPKDLEALKIKAFLLRDDLDLAIGILKQVVALENNSANNIALANLYAQKNELAKARECLLRAYNERQDEGVLLLLSSIDLKTKTLDLELFKAHFGDEMGEVFAQLLLEIDKDAPDLLEAVFLDFYTRKQTPINAKNLAKLYYFQNRIDKIEALEKDGALEVDFALDIYLYKKDFERAENLARRELSRTKRKHYLGVLGIIAFERAKNRAQKKAQIPQVTQNLSEALSEAPNHNFANYLGYLLIDYEIDTQKGIEYVKQALEGSPKNPAYLDSLAWGYFKMGDCKKASATIKQIPQDAIDGEAEIKEHLREIKKCLKKS